MSKEGRIRRAQEELDQGIKDGVNWNNLTDSEKEILETKPVAEEPKPKKKWGKKK